MSSRLFEPVQLGPITLPNRIAMSPMTRCRALADHSPTELMAEYYRQRAGAGLIISEGTIVDPSGDGWAHVGAIYNDAHVDRWRVVTDAVHRQGGRIVCQLWHCGRVAHESQVSGGRVLSSVDHQPPEDIVAHIGDGSEEVPASKAAALTESDMDRLVDAFAAATERARDAGFDGVELHGANGYLIDQFLRDGVNSRTDGYGGSPGNRVKFPTRVVEAIAGAWSADRVGVRVSPVGVYNAMSDSDPEATFTTFVDELNRIGVCYLDVVEPANPFDPQDSGLDRPDVCNVLQDRFNGLYVANGGYDRSSADAVLDAGKADLVCYGRPYIANPDLAIRLKLDAELSDGDHSKNYGGGAEGYIDYPTLAEASA